MTKTNNVQKVLIKESIYSHLNGETANVKERDINENNEIIFCLDIPHPEDENTFLWVNESEVEILK